mmetsp:Transcript_118804/g.216120  ORF Transcript_118804/g.216120 Transcript_118804/m.216120 type:complete len:626 (+) Transcript_118804:83-1960(+)
MTDMLKLCVKTPDGQESEAYLDWAMISGLPELLLPNVQQLAWDMLPDAGEIQAMYIDDEGDRCTLTEGTAADALTFTKAGSQDEEKVLEVTVRSIHTDSTYVDLEAPFPSEADEATCGSDAPLGDGDTTLQEVSAEVQDQDLTPSELQEEPLDLQSAPEDVEPTPQANATDAEFAELSPSMRAQAPSEALSAPCVEVMGESAAASDEFTTESAPAQHRFARDQASVMPVSAPAEPAEEAAPVQHRFARHKAEDVQRCKDDIELYMKQVEEAQLEAELYRMDAEKEQARNEELEARHGALREQFEEECIKAGEAKEHARKMEELAEEAGKKAGEATEYAKKMEELAEEAKLQAAASEQQAKEARELLVAAEAAASRAEAMTSQAVEENAKVLQNLKVEADEANATVAELRAELQKAQAQCDLLYSLSEQKAELCGQLQAKVDKDDDFCNKLQAELTAAKKREAVKQSKASALVANSKPLLFGIEAEEEPKARREVTAQFAETLAKLGARQAFCIGRVRLAAGGIEPATGRPLAAVPASVMVTVINNGSVEWPATAVITSISDDCLGVPVVPLGSVPIGGSKDVEMDLLVPSQPEATTAQYLWAVMDARTSAMLGCVLIFEAVWDSL